MKFTKSAALLLTVLLILSAIPFVGTAAEDYVTRGEAVQTLISAADDYNPNVKKTIL